MISPTCPQVFTYSGEPPEKGRVTRALAGFTLVVETVFNWPGLGNLAILAIKQRDFYLIQTIVFVVAVMVVLVNIAIDVAYKVVDPRVKLS